MVREGQDAQSIQLCQRRAVRNSVVAFASPAAAQSQARIIGTGGSRMVDDGSMEHGRLVSDGRVMATMPSGMGLHVMRLDAMFAQQPREELMALTIGSGKSAETAWVPQAMVDMVRRARFTMMR